jgi:hypothetical protein
MSQEQRDALDAMLRDAPLNLATVWPVTSEHARLATPPAVIQPALFRVLAPAARTTKRQSRSLPTRRVGPGSLTEPALTSKASRLLR